MLDHGECHQAVRGVAVVHVVSVEACSINQLLPYMDTIPKIERGRRSCCQRGGLFNAHRAYGQPRVTEAHRHTRVGTHTRARLDSSFKVSRDLKIKIARFQDQDIKISRWTPVPRHIRASNNRNTGTPEHSACSGLLVGAQDLEAYAEGGLQGTRADGRTRE